YGGGFVRRLVPTGGGGWTLQDFTSDADGDPHTDGHGWYGVDLEQGPDGSLYFMAFGEGGPGDGALWRIEYSPGNARPVAAIDASPLSGPAPLTVDFDASGSTDADNDTLSYEWDFGDGSPPDSSVSVSHEYESDGQYNVTLTADDGRGKTDTDTAVVSVGNGPVAEITGPSSFRAGTPVTFTGSATDVEDGALPDTGLDWQVRLIHGSHTHFLGSYPDTDTIQFTPLTDHDADSHYEVTLTATDSDGLATSLDKRVDPETARVLLESSPTGAPITYGGLDRLAPVDRMAAVGFFSTITAAESFQHDGHTYVFDSWASGGPRSLALSIPPGGLSMLARYTTTVLPPGGGGNTPDTAGPTVRLQRSIARLIRRGLLSGSVSDPDGVRRVDVGLAQVKGKRCRWWHPRKGLARRASSCSRPSWMAAKLSGSKWTVRLRGKVPAGRYRIALRARDRAGHESKRIAAAKLRRR
ncbi:MAG TPA: PKD domain-containing protein, partial [Thermoleophilaceae bacterium]|nr:PKD domain-containing protein [Thermoleophilaceae bacterium]